MLRTYRFDTEGAPLRHVVEHLGDEVGVDYLAHPTPPIRASRTGTTRAEFVARVLRETADHIERTGAHP